MSLGDALIGHSGFVGGTIDRSGWSFVARYNSTNIETMRGRSFDTIICAGVTAVKWKANLEPDADWEGIKRLIDVLTTVSANRFILLSTVDVFPHPIGVTECDRPKRQTGQPYGRNRLELEHWVATRFPLHHILRLPALFGKGLKKNALFDLLVGNQTYKINPNAVFQWYPLRRLPEDMRKVMANHQGILNIAVEPIPMGIIADRLFRHTTIGSIEQSEVLYDMRTCFASLLGGTGRYHIDAATSFAEMFEYVNNVRKDGGVP